MNDLVLAEGFEFGDLYDRDGLVRVDRTFLSWLKEAAPEVHERLLAARAAPDAVEVKDESALILEVAPHLEDFIVHLFGIHAERDALAERHHALSPLYSCKRLFVQRRASRAHKPEAVANFDIEAIEAALVEAFGEPLSELGFARHVNAWLAEDPAPEPLIAEAEKFAAWALHSPEGRERFAGGVLFHQPEKLDFERLIDLETEVRDGVTMMRLPEHRLRRREGFGLTDQGTELVGALDEANYCIFCHHQGKDSCSKGLRDKKDGSFRKSHFDVTLAGCPVEEKISEMHEAKVAGLALGALAIACVDNPLVAGTGHRICNDCMKSCIYQKQEPVDIPQAETRTLKDVLALPWGFEIYGLLTRWNPLHLRRPLPRPETGRKVLVVGLGPAGTCLAHHLMNDGHAVAAVDGLKIEPLPPEISGVEADGSRVPFIPIRDVTSLYEDLDDRLMAGFGGVAEYGITVRWNKNFLKIIRLLLERRSQFAMTGGVRFGGTVTVEGAFAMGFDHIALAMGAGKPTYIAMPNALARGLRMASDFLMALQLTGAAKRSSIANLQLRLPVVVIGGGLTAVDTATEAMAYYPVQVEKFLDRYETLVAEIGEAAVRAGWRNDDLVIAEEFLTHARAIRAERAAAAAEGRAPRIREMVQAWGGVVIAYRKRLIDAPSYTLNHEEVALALEEGIAFAECLAPEAVEVDQYGHAQSLTLARQAIDEDGRWYGTGDQVTLPARSVLVAAGTQPNTVLQREEPDSIMLDGRYFRAINEEGDPVSPARVAKPGDVQVLTSINEDGRAISFFGDLHPSFAGNVVKAFGSAKQGYPVVSRMLEHVVPANQDSTEAFFRRFNEGFRAEVVEVRRLTPTIVEVIVRAPVAANAFQPGQFFRLQNFEARSRTVEGTTLAMEGLAMTGAWVDREKGLVSVIALEMGGSSDLCASLRPGEPVVLMGPTGTPTETPAGETVMLVGGGLGNAVLFSIGRALREAGSRVVYFAGYKRMEDRYKVEEIEAASDLIVWCCDEGPGFAPSRPQDRSLVGNIVEAILAYGEGRLGDIPIPLDEVDRIVTIGSDRMMAAVGAARHGVLASHLKPDHVALGSINSPMQCMMKEICAQCLQPHRDPETGAQLAPVFSCFNQDQLLDRVDFHALAERLGQNRVQERLTAAWLDRCLRRLDLRPAAE